MSQQKLLNWYQQNKRELPWRSTENPYYIWLSEVILQQTRVEQGLNYFLKFVEEFPEVKNLAEASEEKVLKFWQGLGYYSRARNMHKTAKIVHEQYNGKFPEKSDELIQLKGIGPYTAAAIASFAFNEPTAVLDGNVFRVLSRIFNESTPINSTNGKKLFNDLAQEFLNLKFPALHNQAMMELGALICKPQNPNCLACPFNNSCLAFQYKTVKNLPVKEKKLKVKNRYLYYLYFQWNGKTLLRKRTSGDIWEGLFDLCGFESESSLDDLEIIQKIRTFSRNIHGINKLYETKHLLTHRNLFAQFYLVELDAEIPAIGDSFWVENNMLKSFPASRLFEKFQQTLNLHQS